MKPSGQPGTMNNIPVDLLIMQIGRIWTLGYCVCRTYLSSEVIAWNVFAFE